MSLHCACGTSPQSLRSPCVGRTRRALGSKSISGKLMAEPRSESTLTTSGSSLSESSESEFLLTGAAASTSSVDGGCCETSRDAPPGPANTKRVIKSSTMRSDISVASLGSRSTRPPSAVEGTGFASPRSHGFALVEEMDVRVHSRSPFFRGLGRLTQNYVSDSRPAPLGP